MTDCRYDRERSEYVTPDGEPCKRDDYGDPTHHCTARRTCAQHVGKGELTCARCMGRTRMVIRHIVDRAAELPDEAEETGVDSEATNLAGPAADVEAWTWRKVAARQGRAWHVSLVEDDDEEHPYTVLTRWQLMLSEDYGHPLPERMTVTDAAAYLERNLPRVAQDPEQDFGLMSRELKRCLTHVEAVLRDSRAPERGAPCPTCSKQDIVVRLVREYGHWCLEDECEQIHFLDESGDIWRCPVKADHWWSPAGYADVLRDRQEAS